MKKSIIAVLGLVSVMLTSCDNKKNPLTEDWNTPFGIAPFSEIKAEHYKPAIMQALEEHNAEIQAIINNPEEPDFENTIVALDNALPKGQYAVGRHIMTCCEADIAYRGVVADGMGSLKLDTRDWVIVEGKLVEEYSKLYRAKGPVLKVKSITKADKPIQEVATFY